MAQFDLKNANIYLQDGHSATGAVNLMAGYVIGATAIVVDGFTGILPVGARFTVGTDPDEYTITSTAETLGNTTTINFTPGLVNAADDNDVVAVGPRTLRIKVAQGNLTYSEKKPREYIMDRGVIDEVRNGDQQPIDVNLGLQWEFITAHTSESAPTPEDVLKQRGKASSWKSSDPDPCRPYSVNIVLIYTPLCSGVKKEKIVLPYYRYETLDHDAKAGSLATTGKCNAQEAVVTRY